MALRRGRQQQIALCGITAEDIRNAGFHCDVYCCHENGDIITQVVVLSKAVEIDTI